MFRRTSTLALVVISVLTLSQCSMLDRLFGFIGVDIEPPTVIDVSPADGSAGVPTNASISVNFNEIMDTEATEYALAVLPDVAGSFLWEFGDRSMTFEPDDLLAVDTDYHVTISTLAEDGRGNTLETPYQFSFRTGSESDTVAPAPVTSLSATAGDQRVDLSWSNPSGEDFAGVRVVVKSGGYPAGPDDGETIVNGPTNSVTHSGLTNGTTYYYAAFSYDLARNFSDPATISAVPFLVPAEGLLAEYLFSGGTTDTSGNDFDAVNSGAALAADRHGNAASAYSFDGVNDYMTLVGNGETLLGTNPDEWSISVWVQSNAPSSDNRRIVSNYYATGNKDDSFGINFYHSAGLWEYDIRGEIYVSGLYAVSTTPVTSDWTHLVICVGKSQDLCQIWVDGELDVDMALSDGHTDLLTLDLIDSAPIYLGAMRNNNVVQQFFAGRMDDIRIYDHVLSEANISALYQE